MTYKTSLIAKKEELASCPVFRVEHVQWNSTRSPATRGQMAVWKGHGILLHMESDDPNPKRTLTSPMDMVCKDSAMEAFFAFPDRKIAPDEAFAPSDDGLYLNFEVNANGAMYAKTGRGRKGRAALSDEEYASTGVAAALTATGWSMELLLPFPLLQRVAGISTFEAGDVFFCNFYKISEDPAIEHYMSYNKIESETPNFHLPRFFARAVVV